ncbi:MAG TPA: methyltransferase domain-containing protein [Gammaproteobacteria bacterium]|nr:methyltransferase domain-containing protein [Gammaproteobacteria bacterium]
MTRELPIPPKPTEDRNFDDLADKFEKSIYGGLKGRLRLLVLERDLEALPGDAPARILDAGCGTAVFSAGFAARGREVVACDISETMLARARETFAREAPDAPVSLVCAPMQALTRAEYGGFDLILLHGVLEWMADPEAALDHALTLLNPGGGLSLLFYNRHGLVMRSLMLGNLDKVLRGYLKGWKKSLTPTHPQDPAWMLAWGEARGLTLIRHSGVRCFVDYACERTGHQMTEEDVIEAELMLGRQDPYRGIARYVHLLFKS